MKTFTCICRNQYGRELARANDYLPDKAKFEAVEKAKAVLSRSNWNWKWRIAKIEMREENSSL